MSRVFRIQDREGRGPFRPGFSLQWLDDDIADRVRLPSWIEEFGENAFAHAPADAHGFSAVRTLDALRGWFTDAERPRLYAHGYKVVEVPDAYILHESPHQVLCYRHRPLCVGVIIRRPL